MKVRHLLMLLTGASLTVSGIYLELDGQNSGGSLKAVGIAALVAFIFIFYKYLKSKNETTSK